MLTHPQDCLHGHGRAPARERDARRDLPQQFVPAALVSELKSRLVQPLSAFLRVAANESVKSAARISNIANSTATISACVAGLATRYLRRLKLVILAGTAIYTLGLGQPPVASCAAMALLTSFPFVQVS